MPRPCARAGCPNTVQRGGYCAACNQRSPTAVVDKARGSSTERGYGYRWQQARAAFLALPENVLCKDPDGRHVGVYKLATEVDHIVPHRGDLALFWDTSNWQGLCTSCHSCKTAREDGGFGRMGGGGSKSPTTDRA